jgi:hypothetical protein
MDDFETKGDAEETATKTMPKPEKKSPKKVKAPEPIKADMRGLVAAMKQKLTGVNISVDPTKAPYVDFDVDCDINFNDTTLAEMKVGSHVEKGYESAARAGGLATRVSKLLVGQCNAGSRVLKVTLTKRYTYNYAGMRHVTLFLSISRVR